MSLGRELLSARNKSYVVCNNPNSLSFIIGDTDIDLLGSHLPTSPPMTPVRNVGLMSVATEMTVACEMHLNLFAIKLILTCINCDLTADQVEGSVQGAVDSMQHSSSISTVFLITLYRFFNF